MSDVRPARSRGDRGGQPLPDGIGEAPGGEFYFVRGVVLVIREELERDDRLRGFFRGRGRNERAVDEGVLAFDVDDVLETIESARAELGPDVTVEPDYVFLGTQTLKGGPWDEVEPAAPPTDWLDSKLVGDGMTIGILDTGIAYDPVVHPWLKDRFTADQIHDRDVPNVAGAGFLAEQGGHGTFVAGIVSRVAPAAHLAIAKVLDARGFGTTTDLLAGLRKVLAIAAGRGDGRLQVLNLSLGGYAARDQEPRVLGRRLRALAAGGTVVVAAAGNHGSPRPFWPAAMPEVIGVGALDGWGPAVFTNYGPWVDACAPGLDVVSTFFDERQGTLADAELPPDPPPPGPVPVTFPGYGRWSGTSFAAPKVAGGIAAAASTWSVTAAEAADRLVRDWRLYRVPDLGVVVNVS